MHNILQYISTFLNIYIYIYIYRYNFNICFFLSFVEFFQYFMNYFYQISPTDILCQNIYRSFSIYFDISIKSNY